MRTLLADRLSQIKSFLDKHESQPEKAYWEMEDCIEYCHGCIKKRCPEEKHGEDYEGGYGIENDGATRCEDCGKLLDYTLTGYGVDDELEHYENYTPDLSNADECYELGRIAYGICSDNKKLIKRLYRVMRKAGWEQVE